MQPHEWNEVATLVHDSTNTWYQRNRGNSIFPHGPESTMLFCDVYEALDPGCCLVAKSNDNGKIIGSCFYHPRETHVSLGIMNVHAEEFGRGVARALLQAVINLAEQANKPIRLVSSAMNLDSYSLYNKAGFIPRQTYQDMVLEIPREGIDDGHQKLHLVREATLADVDAISQLEQQVAGIRRTKDYVHFINNENRCWHMAVLYDLGILKGWIASIAHPGSNMIGPCIADCQESAIALLLNELNYRRGQTMVFLVPVECDQIAQSAYRWKARNCELHVTQVRGSFSPFNGVAMPTFMPETG